MILSVKKLEGKNRVQSVFSLDKTASASYHSNTVS
ncbi:hypothetical protein RUMTOR_02349 [[Ruminococcus] torques ATCC 27756]|uniref:Uncharacterized protein n=1 Tax=[Ruminococcus] torques ATCC 27756 TaxID=411460 RepID=A5KQ13_9FIRM|nr:hypothetical protein RUMTOR_02349 [[Ruminococcus] torques ATCC 27756]